MAEIPPQNPDRPLVQIASYNTNLQGNLGLPQDLVDWLSPALQVSNFFSRQRRAPDIVAVGFQELLPLHLGLSGFSKSVIESRNALIISQIEAHAPNKERYALIAKVVNCGVALLVYGRDDGVARTVCDVRTQWTGCGPGFMGNKGAVGVRFRIPGTDGDVGETYTFVCAHLTAHAGKVAHRLADYRHIVGTLLFPPVCSESNTPSTIYSTSHLFVFGDLNFRLEIPSSHPLSTLSKRAEFAEALNEAGTRQEFREFDELVIARHEGRAFVGLHEGEFWKFKCSYKYLLGEVDKYNMERTPAWTDRVLYATHTDLPETPEETSITNLLYTSIPSYTTSDHKPIVCLLLLPPSTKSSSTVALTIRLQSNYTPVPDSRARLKRYMGRSLDRVVGICWYLVVLLGTSSGLVGIFNIFLALGTWFWWKSR